jgi:hypothetical protein
MSKSSAKQRAQVVTEWYQWLNKTYDRKPKKPKFTVIDELEEEMLEMHEYKPKFIR